MSALFCRWSMVINLRDFPCRKPKKVQNDCRYALFRNCNLTKNSAFEVSDTIPASLRR